MDGNQDGGAMEPLLEGEPFPAGLPSSSLRRTLSEQLADLEAAQKAHLEDTRVTLTQRLWTSPCPHHNPHGCGSIPPNTLIALHQLGNAVHMRAMHLASH
jgi:hypothetical protein